MRHFVNIEAVSDSYRTLQYHIDQQPIVFFNKNLANINYSNLNKGMAVSEKLKLYVQEVDTNKFLVRYHNLDEQQTMQIKLDAATEMSLTGNQKKSEMMERKIKWKTQTQEEPECNFYFRIQRTRTR